MAKVKKSKSVIKDFNIDNEDIIDVDIADELKYGTLNYSISVITDRALPDIKDGLKPAQRRNLFSLYHNKIFPNGNYVKCAKISGDVMGNLHPHGCIAADTQVYLTKGEIKTIYELYQENQIDENKKFEVLAFDENGNLVVDYMSHVRIGQYSNKIYHIKLSNGGELHLTENHPIRLLDLSYKRADELQVGDELINILLRTNHRFYDNIQFINGKPIKIVEINIEHLKEKIPMYDFSCNKYENALFITKNTDKNIFIENKKENIDLVCLHNSTYSTLVNMSQPWTFRYPLIDFHGNNGSPDGDPVAADRYTEAKLHKNAMYLLDGLNEDCVPMIDNYIKTLKEPVLMPGLFPNLFCNGAIGIAVGYATNFPPHNLNEIVDAIIYRIKNPDCKVKELLKFIKGPDFPEGAEMFNEGIEELYTTGKARLHFRSSYKIEDNRIIFTSICDRIDKPKLIEKLYELCIDKKTQQIKNVIDIRDESSGEKGTYIVVELSKTGIPELVLKELFEKSQLEVYNTYTMRYIDDKTPLLNSITDMFDKYIEFHKEVLEKRLIYKKNELLKKLNVQEGYIKIVDDINNVIKIIRSSLDDNVVIDALIKKYKLEKDQADLIINMKLKSLARLDKTKIKDEIKKLQDGITEIDNINIKDYFILKLEEMKNDIGDERRTKIIKPQKTVIKDYIIALNEKNQIKIFEELNTKNIKYYFTCKNTDKILIIFNDCSYIVSDINNLDFKKEIKFIAKFEENKYLFMILENQVTLIKKIPINKLKKSGTLIEGNLIRCMYVNNTDDEIVNVLSENNKVKRFKVSSFKETNIGGKGIELGCTINDFDISTNEEYLYLIGDNEACKLNINDFLVKSRIASPISATKGIMNKIYSSNTIYDINGKEINIELKNKNVKPQKINIKNIYKENKI